MDRQTLTHPFAPVVDQRCRVLVLGSFPSVKSREITFYYGHPQNRFWRVLAAVYGEAVPQKTQEKRAFVLRHGIALWDVISRCEIAGSADSSIRGAIPNDLPALLADYPQIKSIVLNGKTAEKVYWKYWKALPLPVYTLPSTSPANAAWTLDRLIEAWGAVLQAKG